MRITMSKDASQDVDSRSHLLRKMQFTNVEVTTLDGITHPWGTLDRVDIVDDVYVLAIQPDSKPEYVVPVMDLVEVVYL